MTAAKAPQPQHKDKLAPVQPTPGKQHHHHQYAHRQPPRIGPMLLLRPWHNECAFWASSLYKRVASDMDMVNLSLRCLEVYFVLFRSWVQVADDSLMVIQGVFHNTVLLVLLHIALRMLMPAIYNRWHWVLVVHMRLYNLLSGIAILRELRGLLTRGPSSPLLDYLTRLPTHPTPRLATARALAMALLTFRALGQSLPPLIPLPLNAALQTTFLLAVIRYMSGPVATFFSHPVHTPNIRHLCRTVASWTVPPPATPLLPTAPLHNICATPQSAWVLALFLPLFGTVALPLYIAYISERALKRRFVAANTPTPSPRSPPSAPPPPAPHSPAAPCSPAPALATPPTASPASSPGPPAPHPQQPHPTPPCAAPQHPQLPPARFGPGAPKGWTAKLLRMGGHLLCVWLLAAVCWAAAVTFRGVVARTLVKPLWSSANQLWYWQLLCGDDQPCCPAA